MECKLLKCKADSCHECQAKQEQEIIMNAPKYIKAAK